MKADSRYVQSDVKTTPVQRLSKIGLRKTEKHTEYATERFVKDSLKTIEAKYSLPVSEALTYLRQGKVDSISLSRETP